MKNFFMLLMIYISCLLYSLSLSSIIFLISLSVIWLGVFEYIKYVIQRGVENPSPCVSNLKYMVFVFIFAMINPAPCLMLVFFFHPLYLSKRLRLTHQVNMISVNRGCVNSRSYSNDSSFALEEHDFQLGTSGNIIGGSPSYCAPCVAGSLINITHDVLPVNAAHDSRCESYIFSDAGFDSGLSDINPASGMPMIGGVDICGDSYGVNSHTDY